MWPIILFVLLIYSFIRGTFEAEAVTRKSLVIIPSYALVMMICSLAEENFNHKLILTAILLVVGILIGLSGHKSNCYRHPRTDRYGRPIIKVKRNWPYLFGWIIVFVIDIAIEFTDQASINGNAVVQELVKEILKDLSSIAFFSFSNEWFVWVLTVATSFAYGITLLVKYPKIRQAVARRHRKS
ncbi:MAG: hydrophobic protein [Limosilactobacillus pontis]